MTKLFAAVCVLGCSTFAQQIAFTGQSGVISQFVDGDGWQTRVSLNNMDATPSQYKLSFFKEDGSPMTTPTNLGTGTFIYGTLPAHGSVTISTPGTSSTLSVGWALMETIFVVPGASSTIAPGAAIAGTVLFFRPSTGPRPTEASEPIDFSAEDSWVLPFDHTGGYTSGVAFVNPLTFEDVTIYVTIYGESGNQILLDSFTLLRGQHTAFTLTQKYPQTIGLRGMLNIQSSGDAVNVLGLHTSPTGVISSTSPSARL